MLALAHPRTWPIWDIFFPPLCTVCVRDLERDDILFCRQCWADAPIADMRDLHKLKFIDMAVSGFRYAGVDVVRASVRALKYEGMTAVARPMVSRLLTRIPTRYVEADLTWTPVPLHWRRQLERGSNQSKILARELARLTGHDMPQPLLRRVRYTPTQTTRSYRERHANIQNAFAVRNLAIPEKVLLIDDIITTGATMDECARMLKNAGAKWVGALSFGLSHH